MSQSLLQRALVGLPRRMQEAAQSVLPAIRAAASRAGADFSALMRTARLESGFNARAKASTSSATGLFQFIDSTWLATLERHGGKYGIAPRSRAEALALRNNPEVASLMAAEHMAENSRALKQGLGRTPNATDLYLAHFLGVGGALRFLDAKARNGGVAAASVAPAAAAANRGIFFAGKTPRSLDAVYALLAGKMAGATAPPEGAAPPSFPAGIRPVLPVAGGSAPFPGAGMPPALAAQIATMLLPTIGEGREEGFPGQSFLGQGSLGQRSLGQRSLGLPGGLPPGFLPQGSPQRFLAQGFEAQRLPATPDVASLARLLLARFGG